VAPEVTVTNPSYWVERAPQLAQLLRTAEQTDSPRTIGDPTGRPADPNTVVAIADPMFWSTQPRELQEALRIAAQGVTPTQPTEPPSSGAAGATSVSHERLTLTVEEAAAALGISRAFAYEAVTRNQIPHIRIGRRILVPRAALQRMLDGLEESKET